MTTNRPRMSSTSFGGKPGISISHSELLTFVNNSLQFEAKMIGLNPGLVNSFPWLASVANAYEKYRFSRLVFEYVPATSSSTVGQFAMGIDYDAADQPPASLLDVSQYSGAEITVPWAPVRLTADQAALSEWKYVRANTVVGTDIKTYDIGNLFLVTQAGVDVKMVGAVRVHYTCHLTIPQSNARSLVSEAPATEANVPTFPASQAGDMFAAASAVIANTNPTALATFVQAGSSNNTYVQLAQGVWQMASRITATTPTNMSGQIAEMLIGGDQDTISDFYSGIGSIPGNKMCAVATAIINNLSGKSKVRVYAKDVDPGSTSIMTGNVRFAPMALQNLLASNDSLLQPKERVLTVVPFSETTTVELDSSAASDEEELDLFR